MENVADRPLQKRSRALPGNLSTWSTRTIGQGQGCGPQDARVPRDEVTRLPHSAWLDPGLSSDPSQAGQKALETGPEQKRRGNNRVAWPSPASHLPRPITAGQSTALIQSELAVGQPHPRRERRPGTSPALRGQREPSCGCKFFRAQQNPGAVTVCRTVQAGATEWAQRSQATPT